MLIKQSSSAGALKALAFAAALLVGNSSQAAITIYTSQADFLSHVVAPGVDTFNDLELGGLPVTLTRNAGPYTYQVTSIDNLWAAGNGVDPWLSNAGAYTNPIVFSNFSSGVNAFGGFFFPNDISGFDTPGNVILTADDGTTYTYHLNNATTSSFVGFVSDQALVSVSLASDGGDYWPTANDVVLAVPEPGTFGMLVAGLGLIGVIGCRRRG